VKIPTALQPDTSHHHDHQMLVVAKHLCGVGTDLALKSIEPIRYSVTAVIMSTCCHGVCHWNDYVGRDYLIDAILTKDTTSSTLSTFGQDEFDLMRLWSSGTVQDNNNTDAPKVNKSSDASKLPVDGDDDDFEGDDIHPNPNEMCNDSSKANGFNHINVTKVVEALNLQCGVQGLGRVCQRLIDYGRCEYLRHVIFNEHDHNDRTTSNSGNHIQSDNNNNIIKNDSSKNSSAGSKSTVELVYYVPESITPQNALLLAYRSQSQ
jgi:tRNA:m4X modification enzyme